MAAPCSLGHQPQCVVHCGSTKPPFPLLPVTCADPRCVPEEIFQLKRMGKCDPPHITPLLLDSKMIRWADIAPIKKPSCSATRAGIPAMRSRVWSVLIICWAGSRRSWSYIIPVRTPTYFTRVLIVVMLAFGSFNHLPQEGDGRASWTERERECTS